MSAVGEEGSGPDSVVVAVSLSARSEKTLAVAVRIAGSHPSSRLVVVHAFRRARRAPMGTPDGFAQDFMEHMALLGKAEEARLLSRLVEPARRAGVDVQVKAVDDRPLAAVLQTASAGGIVVMGLPWWPRLVAHRVQRRVGTQTVLVA